MRRMLFLVLGAIFFLFVPGSIAGSHDLSEFPLRVHIFNHSGRTHYFHQTLDWVDGEGRANLFENGEVHAFDFAYRCDVHLMDSPGFETFPARWRKKDSTLQILLPEMGKPGSSRTCDLKVEMKPGLAYFRQPGIGLATEPSENFKRWMEKHQYDPEHGKNQPTNSAPQGAPSAVNAPAPATPDAIPAPKPQ